MIFTIPNASPRLHVLTRSGSAPSALRILRHIQRLETANTLTLPKVDSSPLKPVFLLDAELRVLRAC